MIKLILKGGKRINQNSLLVKRQNEIPHQGLAEEDKTLALKAAEANRMYYSMAEMSIAEMPVGRNVRGRNVRGRNVLSEMSVAEMSEHQVCS